MNDNQKAKIKQFLGDKEMQSAIKNILRDKFLEKKSTDVHYLASQALAVQLLTEAWVEMERYKQNETEKPIAKQVGL